LAAHIHDVDFVIKLRVWGYEFGLLEEWAGSEYA
jgi:hypothetical protein